MKNRATLKDYFRKGRIPTESNFSDLVDSMLIQDEDNLLARPNEAVSIKSVGEKEQLINFYRVENGEETLSWKMMQKPGETNSGLAFHDNQSSRLFIESGSGNVGVGTTTPSHTLTLPGGTANLSLGDNIFINGKGDTGRISNNAYINKEGKWALANPNELASTMELRNTGCIDMYGTRTKGKIDWTKMFGFNAVDKKVSFPTGKVGIGTENPEAKLHVEGTAKIEGNLNVKSAITAETLSLKKEAQFGANVRFNGAALLNKSGKNIIETNKDDWLRVNRDAEYPGTAIYNPVAIGTGGLSIGDWKKPAKGILYVQDKAGIGTSAPKVKLHITGGSDVQLKENTGYLILGDATKKHLALDNNEIMAKTNGTTAGTLSLQFDGGKTIVGGDMEAKKKLTADSLVVTNTADVAALVFDRSIKAHISNKDGALYRYNGQCYLTTDDYLYFRRHSDNDANSMKKVLINVTNGSVCAKSFPKMSDARLKENIEDYKGGLNEVLQLSPVRYHYKDQVEKDLGSRHIGFLAQDVKKILPEIVQEFGYKEGDEDYLAMDYTALTPVLINSVKELATEIQYLKEKLDKTKH
ncbi:MAG: tail fiber domain-containing protein [Pseudomonadales bacterium]|nr:tail fiber domain-containing protein [Pseudomonadales bacterium]